MELVLFNIERFIFEILSLLEVSGYEEYFKIREFRIVVLREHFREIDCRVNNLKLLLVVFLNGDFSLFRSIIEGCFNKAKLNKHILLCGEIK
jgi:hypothetical protein